VSARSGSAAAGAEAVWHDVECGAYGADLALWEELARGAGGPVLELGAGTGRVALRLAAAGLDVTAIDSDPELLGALAQRAAERGLEVPTALADARELALGRRFAAILAPMQLGHLMGGERGRLALLDACARHLEPGGFLAAALLAEDAVEEVAPAAGAGQLLPDVLERDGWVHSSLPVEVAVETDRLEVRRLRQLVSPEGKLSERISVTRLDRVAAGRFEREAAAVGLTARERIEIPATDDHVASVVCVLEAPR
jgi:SAM-dependent methyltransferase